MTETRTLPHDPYITAVEQALTAASLEPETTSTFEDELDGHPLLRGSILLTPETTGIPADQWPHGLLLVWEWHTGRNPEIDRGPSWSWSRATAGGWADAWQPLPVAGWTVPTSLAIAVTSLADTGTPTATPAGLRDAVAFADIERAIGMWEAGQ